MKSQRNLIQRRKFGIRFIRAYFMEEVPMHRINVFAIAAIVVLGFLIGFTCPASSQSVTAYEGARLIVGDGSVIDKGTLIVEGAKITQASRTADVRVPGGAKRVDLAGKTVM